jgi:hypothetical protein
MFGQLVIEAEAEMVALPTVQLAIEAGAATVRLFTLLPLLTKTLSL